MAPEQRLQLAAGTATGVGSLPGTDVREAVRLVFDELPDLPHVPELPHRGAGADLTGRAAGLLVDLHVEVTPTGWRITDRPGRDERRARTLLEADLDALEERAAEYEGPLKLQVAGPWTLAATLELKHGDKAVSDPGASRDIAASLAEGIVQHLAGTKRRVPGAWLLLQLDEPSLPAVSAGAVRTASGLRRLPPVEEPVLEEALRTVMSATDVPVVVHSCAPAVPSSLLRRAGAAAVSLDATLLTPQQEESLAELLEAGVLLFAGVVPALDGVLSDLRDTVGSVRALGRRLGVPADRLAETVVVTPTCGLAGATPAHARAAMKRCREAARVVAEEPEGS